jgi:hypothetical protein
MFFCIDFQDKSDQRDREDIHGFDDRKKSKPFRKNWKLMVISTCPFPSKRIYVRSVIRVI